VAAVIALDVIVLRLGLALAFGIVIGIEREWRQKHAGLKTMALVALGAAAFAMLSNIFGPNNHNPGQIASAVVGGIGFIGAGVIMHRGATVQGVTTAATLWAAASVGVAAGLGQLPMATILTAGIVTLQFLGRSIETRVHFLRHDAVTGRYELLVECDSASLHEVNETWMRVPDVTALHRSVQREGTRVTITIILQTAPSFDSRAIEESLVALEGVHRVELRHLGLEAD
jgi:uncharacterized membrane protein YhiD involved in acid resistance